MLVIRCETPCMLLGGIYMHHSEAIIQGRGERIVFPCPTYGTDCAVFGNFWNVRLIKVGHFNSRLIFGKACGDNLLLPCFELARLYCILHILYCVKRQCGNVAAFRVVVQGYVIKCKIPFSVCCLQGIIELVIKIWTFLRLLRSLLLAATFGADGGADAGTGAGTLGYVICL